MPLTVDTSYAPQLLIYRLTEWPSPEEQNQVRARLLVDGLLDEYSCVLVDLRSVRDLPKEDNTKRAIPTSVERRRPLRTAYVIATADQSAFLDRLQHLAPPYRTIQAFFAERAGMMWLFPNARFPLSYLNGGPADPGQL